jgi:hypothetical protein
MRTGDAHRNQERSSDPFRNEYTPVAAFWGDATYPANSGRHVMEMAARDKRQREGGSVRSIG